VYGFGGGRLALLDERLVRAALAWAKLGQFLLVRLLVVVPGGVQHGPPGLDDSHAAGAEGHPVRLPQGGCHLLHAGRVEGGDQSGDDRLVDVLLRRRQGSRPLPGREDRVVVPHLRVVDEATGESEGPQVQPGDLVGLERPQSFQEGGELLFHVAGQVARVGARVGDQLGLVEGLGCLEGGVGRQAVPPVHVPLQLRQVVELRRQLTLLLAIDGPDHEGVALHPVEDRAGGLLLRKPVPGGLERDLAVERQEFPERLGLERTDLIVAPDDHRQHRGLHPTDTPEEASGVPVADGVVAGRVEPHDPVGLAAAAGCGVERVVVGKRPQAPKGVADGTRGQGVEPEPPGRLGSHPGQFQDVAEDQLAFPAGVRGADQLIGGAEEALDDGELLAGTLLIEKLELEAVRDEGQRGQRPLLQGRVVILGFLERDQVAQRPGHLIALTLEVAVTSGAGPKEGGEFAGDRRFLGEHDSHDTSMVTGE
jgi:hypothetical protein